MIDARDPVQDVHLSEEELAVLADGREPRNGPDPRLQHLARCRSCMAAYADAVRYRAAWLARPERFTTRLPSRRALGWATRRRVGNGWVLAAASLAVAVGMTTAFLGVFEVQPRSLPSGVRPVLEAASSTGLVLPGGHAGAAPVSSSYRSNPPVPQAAADAIEDMRVRYENGERSLDHLFALSDALIAARQIDLARDYTAEGLRLAPSDPRFLLLAGILADLDGAPERAEQLLRAARREAPHDPTVALDLGLILVENRGLAAAAPLLREVIANVPGTPLAVRAGRVLTASPPR
jgi:tetratricopeptide (TPR) repeat protein